MTNQQINECIAKLCGWTSKEETIERVSAGYDWTETYTTWSHPGRGRHLKPPNYSGSLDCCREFEKFSSSDDWNAYFEQLIWVCERDETEPMIALASQRCEAFLRVKGLWTGTNEPNVK